MSAELLIAEFAGADRLVDAARRAREDGFAPLDALTPCFVEGLDDLLGLATSPIRWPMLLGGLGVAALLFALEAWSAIVAYPFDSGARPLFSWQVFLLAPLELGAFAAAAAGFVALLALCGLPRLHHPLFDWDPIARATIDRYFLVIAEPAQHGDAERLRLLLDRAGMLNMGRTRQ